MFLFEELFKFLKEYKFNTLNFIFNEDFLEINIDVEDPFKQNFFKIIKHFFIEFSYQENLKTSIMSKFYGITIRGKVNQLFKLWYDQNYSLKNSFSFNEIINFQNLEEKDSFFEIRNRLCKNFVLTKELKFKYIGQFNKEYLIFKIKNNLLFIDQHAIHERILLNELITVKGLSNFDQIAHLRSLACKNAIKFGEKVEFSFVKKIIRSLFKNKFIMCCAHGRYTMHILLLNKD